MKYDDDFKEFADIDKKLSKGTKVFLITLLLLVIGAGIYFGGTFVMKSFATKDIYEILIDKFANKLKINKNSKTLLDTFDGNLKFSFRNENQVKIENSFDIKGKIGRNVEEKYISGNVDLKYSDKNILNMNLLVENNNIYLYSKKLYSKYVSKEIAEEEFNNMLNNFNADYQTIIVNNIVDALKSSLKEEYFDNELVIIDKKPCVKHILSLDEKSFYILIRNIFEKLNNDEFKNQLTNLSIDRDKIDSFMSEFITEMNTKALNSSSNNKITLSIYLDIFTQDLLKLDFKFNSNIFELSKTDENQYYLEYKSKNDVVFYGRLNLFEKETSINFHFNKDDDEYDLGLVVITDNNKQSFNIEILDKNLGEIKIGFNEIIEYDKEIEKNVVNKIIKYEDLTDKDKENMLNKLYSSEGYLLFSNDLANILMTTSISELTEGE